MTESLCVRRLVRAVLLLVSGGCAALPARAASGPDLTTQSRVTYRLVWIATRADNHTPILSVAMPIRPRQSATINTDSTVATEEKPAFPRFTARLGSAKPTGVFQLVTRASVRETARNKKGKLKRSKRNIGALVPIRAGETQVVSSSSDPIQLAVRLERE